ncbi:lipase family protein [Ectobacillus ponti]|uniref:Lipase family protein n=1 Tax=Ectobacillus ponti TaxID=2961894 RepID=A0AA41X2N5_9BACI|nr:lipase family protein [Ectobacillus ponti]MCP8967597.1 lipase family protein [Ectobacillus ponti]
MATTKELALLSADCCILAYTQYQQNGIFPLPDGFGLVQGFQAKAIDTITWFGFILESDQYVIVAFRGTQSDPDWIADSLINQREYPYTANSGFVHNGFLSIYESCRDSIMESLVHLPADKTLLVTGHSLGGALAVLHALDARVNTKFKDYIMFNFGAPKVGDIAFRNYYNLQVANSTRLVNLFDIVPLLPPRKILLEQIEAQWEYFHVNRVITFAANQGSIIKNHEIFTYRSEVEKWR